MSDAASSGSSSGLFDYWLRYQGRTTGYLLLLTDRYPSFSDRH